MKMRPICASRPGRSRVWISTAVRSLNVVADHHLGRHVEMFVPARHAPAYRGAELLRELERLGQGLADVFDARPVIADRCAMLVQDDVGIQAEAVGAGDDAGVHDGQAQGVQGVHRGAEQVAGVRGVDKDLRPSRQHALTGLLNQHQWVVRIFPVQQGFGMPGDVLHPQEVFVPMFAHRDSMALGS